MKKRILSLALVLILTLALAPAAFAAPIPDWVIEFDDGTIYTVSVVTPHEYLGFANLGELWVLGEPRDWNFDVFVVDDSVTFFERRIDFSNPKAGNFAEESWGDIYVGNGYLEMIYMTMDGFAESYDYTPYYTFGRSLSNGCLDTHLVQRYDEYGDGQGWLITLDIVLTKSEFSTFKTSGELPEFLSVLSPYADLSELKALLNNAQLDPDPITAMPTASTVLVNGQSVEFDAYNIKDNNYFKLRDLAYILSGSEKQFEVEWDGENNAIRLTSGKPYTEVGGEMTGKGPGEKTPLPTSATIYLDGKEITLTAYNIDGNNYFKLRDVGAALDFEVDWDGANNTVIIDTSKGYTPD